MASVFSADYSQLSFTPLICVQRFNACLTVPELLTFNKLSCLITIRITLLVYWYSGKVE